MNSFNPNSSYPIPTAMSIHHLFEILLNYGPLPAKLYDKNFVENLKAYLLPFITPSIYTRRQLLLSAGQVAEYIYFLEKGLARGFYIHESTRKEITDFLWGKHSIITVPDSFFQQRPSHLFIEVMSGTQLMYISYRHLMACFKKYPVTQIFSRNVIVQYNAHEIKKNRDRAFLLTWERYIQLLKKHPDIEQQVSKEIIASYLNITPQSLSRLLREKGHP